MGGEGEVPLIPEIPRSHNVCNIAILFLFARQIVIVNPCRGEAGLALTCAFPSAVLNRRQWRVVICFVLPQANASRDFARAVAVRRIVKEVGFFIGVVVQVE